MAELSELGKNRRGLDGVGIHVLTFHATYLFLFVFNPLVKVRIVYYLFF
jgi:hypothetical protein